MSKTAATFPIFAALKGAEKFLGSHVHWLAVNPTQKALLAGYSEKCRQDIGALKEIETRASASAEEVNAFLKTKGFDITLEKFKQGEFGVASVLNVLVEWLGIAMKAKVVARRSEYPAVYLKEGLSVHQTLGHPNPIARLETKSGDVVYMTELKESSLQPDVFGLIRKVGALSTNLTPADKGYDAVLFPMVDLNQFVNIDWLLGLKTTDANGYGWMISQAKQQTKFRMNEVGARAESAAAIEVMATSVARPKPTLVIDSDFFLWIERPGLSHPLFAAHLTPEDWKEPSKL